MLQQYKSMLAVLEAFGTCSSDCSMNSSKMGCLFEVQLKQETVSTHTLHALATVLRAHQITCV